MIPQLGVCYYPEQWPEDMWEADANEMSDLGLSLVRIGEFAWSRLEPSEGKFQFDWLDRVIQVLGDAELKVILGTPSATPPRWMVDKFPEMLTVNNDGQERKFGSRRHYCFSHKGYRDISAKMASRLAKRYANNPHIHSWQIDNEYGCHETILSYSQSALRDFRVWLIHKYSSISALNTAWGNVFWSMEYGAFEEVGLPNLTVTEANPSHRLDFKRFSSDQVARFNAAQCVAIRQYCDKPLIHNYMGRITDFDHFKVGKDLDIASWDSYPLGFLEDRSNQPEDFRHDFQRQGDPDFQAFHHDLYRAVGKGRWGIMEQQPGPVNWAPYNPAPLPDMVRLWSWEAIAHAAEFVSYFRWRQAPFAQEQMHSGLKRPDNKPAQVCNEIKLVSTELLDICAKSQARIGIVFDYESAWAWGIQSHGQDFDYFRLVYDFYVGLRQLGQTIDVISPQIDNFNGYDFIIIPGLFHLSPKLSQIIAEFQGEILVGPRAGSKTPEFQITINPLKAIGLNIFVSTVETLRPTELIKLNCKGGFKIWREFIDTNHEVVLTTEDNNPALIQSGRLNYLCGWPDNKAMIDILSKLLKQADLKIYEMPKGLRCRQIGEYRFYLNYNNSEIAYEDFILPAAGIRLENIKTKTIMIEK